MLAQPQRHQPETLLANPVRMLFGRACGRVVSALVACALAASAALGDVVLQRVGGSQIAVETLGRVGPVIVFESALGEDMRGWEKVALPLAACAYVVLYDRPGIGRSAPRVGTSLLLANTVADQLAELLQAIGVAPPYILVGHSLGGLYVQAFARSRPQDIAAVVLVDSASPFELPGVFVSTT
jgi:pimeloyl-ACP methyl ester carboxylesterase